MFQYPELLRDTFPLLRCADYFYLPVVHHVRQQEGAFAFEVLVPGIVRPAAAVELLYPREVAFQERPDTVGIYYRKRTGYAVPDH